MLISSMSIIANICVLIFHHKNVKVQGQMPRWVRVYICGHLARILGMNYPTHIHNYNKQIKESPSAISSLFVNAESLCSKSLLANALNLNDSFAFFVD